ARPHGVGASGGERARVERGARLDRAVESKGAIGWCAPGEAPAARAARTHGLGASVAELAGLGRGARMVRAWRGASRAGESTHGRGASVAELAGLGSNLT